MKPYFASLINAIILITFGLWGYFSAETPSATAFIPVGIGAVLLIITPSFKKENKVIAHIAVTLTIVVLLGLIMPLKGSIHRGDNLGLIRVLVMMATSIFALTTFVKSFINARKNPAKS